jgi:hypothetical protein
MFLATIATMISANAASQIDPALPSTRNAGRNQQHVIGGVVRFRHCHAAAAKNGKRV